MRIDILGIGHCCQDNICIVEQYPQEDSSTHILNIDDSQGGGAAATAMVAASRLGAAAGIIANLGDDEVGDRILKGFVQEGVDTTLIRRIPGGRSSTSYVLVNPENGSRTKFPYRDSLPDITFGQEIRSALSGARVLHLDGTQYSNALQAARLAKELGVTVSLDACSMQAENVKNWELAGLADILITNEKYPCRLTGHQDLGAALLEMYRMLGRRDVGSMTAGVPGLPTTSVPGMPTAGVPGMPTAGVHGMPTASVPGMLTAGVPGMPTTSVPEMPTASVPGLPAPDAPKMSSRGGPTVLAATAGKQGCFYIVDGQVRHMPAFPVKAADTTGAGDTFHGAFLAHWIRGNSLESCLRFAGAAAAIKCMKYGGRDGIPDRKTVEAFLMKVTMENKIY